MIETDIKLKTPKTLQEAIRYYADPDVTFALMVKVRFPNGVYCQTCGDKEPRFIATRRMFECRNKHAKRQFSVKKGTIFEDSPIGLDKWFTAMWLLNNCKNGVSSLELHRAIGVTQKTAWFMLHRIRFAMHHDSLDMMGGGGGVVEADETYIGGKARNMHKHVREKRLAGGRGGAGKELVMGLLDRETGKIRVKHVAARNRETMHAEVRDNVATGSKLFTDDLASYTGLGPDFVHEFVNHAEEYVRGNVHTNGLENFWSLLKRGLKGTYVSVEPFHLFRYLDEQAFRYNERKKTDAERFAETLSGIAGKRLMYKELTGKVGCAPTAATA